MICFVDDQCVTGSSKERVKEAGTASTQESYLGLQDALRKVCAPRGVRQPGAWAGANVCIGENGEVIVLTLQESGIDSNPHACTGWESSAEETRTWISSVCILTKAFWFMLLKLTPE